MPVEIRELNIRVSVNQQTPEHGAAAPAATNPAGGGANKDEIIAECVEQIMEILQNKKER